jgi:hypothetical protein
MVVTRSWALCILFVAGCAPSDEMPAEVRACVARHYANYNPKDFDQCVTACIACSKGVMTTCSTSCRLKGAR